MKEDFWQKTLKSASTFLKRWNGGTARIWHFQSPHSSMTIRIEKQETIGNLHIRCGNPEFIHGPTIWENCEIDIQPVTGELGELSSYLVRDLKAGFEIRTETVELAENCKPL